MQFSCEIMYCFVQRGNSSQYRFPFAQTVLKGNRNKWLSAIWVRSKRMYLLNIKKINTIGLTYAYHTSLANIRLLSASKMLMSILIHIQTRIFVPNIQMFAFNYKPLKFRKSTNFLPNRIWVEISNLSFAVSGGACT